MYISNTVTVRGIIPEVKTRPDNIITIIIIIIIIIILTIITLLESQASSCTYGTTNRGDYSKNI